METVHLRIFPILDTEIVNIGKHRSRWLIDFLSFPLGRFILVWFYTMMMRRRGGYWRRKKGVLTENPSWPPLWHPEKKKSVFRQEIRTQNSTMFHKVVTNKLTDRLESRGLHIKLWWRCLMHTLNTQFIQCWRVKIVVCEVVTPFRWRFTVAHLRLSCFQKLFPSWNRAFHTFFKSTTHCNKPQQADHTLSPALNKQSPGLSTRWFQPSCC